MKMPHFQHGQKKSRMLRNFDKCFQQTDNNNNILYAFQQEIKVVVQPCILKQNQKFNCISIIKSRCSRNPSFISPSPATPVNAASCSAPPKHHDNRYHLQGTFLCKCILEFKKTSHKHKNKDQSCLR